MDYRLEEAGPERVQGSDAVLVAEALGLNESVVRRARELLASGSNAEMGESIDE
jgi:DNA mismatch repair ATPase MutS